MKRMLILGLVLAAVLFCTHPHAATPASTSTVKAVPWYQGQIFSIIIGAFIGFGAGQGNEFLKRKYWEKRDRDKTLNNLLLALKEEIIRGYNRQMSMLKLYLREHKWSLSSIDTGIWDSVKSDILKDETDREMIKAIAGIYYAFSLVKLHADNWNFPTAHGFARSSHIEMEENFVTFKILMMKRGLWDE